MKSLLLELLKSLLGILDLMNYTGPRPLSLEQVALTDLLRSGGLEYLGSSELRRAIADYELWLNRVTLSHAAIQRYFDEHVNSYYAAHASMPDFFNTLGGVFGEYEFPVGDFSIDTFAFVQNRTFANIFATYLWTIEATQNSESMFLQSASDVEALLGG